MSGQIDRSQRRSLKSDHRQSPAKAWLSALDTSLAFLAFGLGAFCLTIPGVTIWIGAALWLMVGMRIQAVIKKRIRDIEIQATNAARHEQDQREKALDHELEKLHDQNWELREAELKYKSLLDGQGDIILHVAEKGDILFANSSFGHYFDTSQNKQKSPFTIEPQSENEHSQTEEQALLDRGPDLQACEQCLPTEQGAKWFRWTEASMRTAHEGKSQRLIIARDITAFKKAEAASEAKSRFLATISHEMRTPLNGVIGMANLLDATPLTAEQRSYCQAVRQSGSSLLALVNDVLDISRIEANKLTLKYEWQSPARLVEEVVELLAPDAQEKGLSIASWIAPEIPDRVLIDPMRCRQILINLLGNAVKFTQEGAVNVTLKTIPANQAPSGLEEQGIEQDQDSDVILLSFSVHDTGQGISKDLQERLFGEFEQADSTRERRHEGAGLGLAISRRLARLMKGEIMLTSEPEEGSVFSLVMPASFVEREVATGRSESEPPEEGSSLEGKSLLGLDLTPADQMAFASYCQDWGLKAEFLSQREWEANPAKKHVDHLLINSAEPDTIQDLLNQFDPAKTGQLTRPMPTSRVVLLEPSQRHVIPQMRDCGITAYLVKPVRKASLLFALQGDAEKRDTNEQPLERAKDQADRKAPPSPENAPEGEKSQGHPKVLLVEDNEINALLARSILKKAGMQVLLAQSGNEAIDLYAAHSNFDIALLDLHMPDMDGLKLFDVMKEIDEERDASIPKVAFTADILEETKQTCLSHGFADYIAKPADPQLLIAKVQNITHNTQRDV